MAQSQIGRRLDRLPAVKTNLSENQIEKISGAIWANPLPVPMKLQLKIEDGSVRRLSRSPML